MATCTLNQRGQLGHAPYIMKFAKDVTGIVPGNNYHEKAKVKPNWFIHAV